MTLIRPEGPQADDMILNRRTKLVVRSPAARLDVVAIETMHGATIECRQSVQEVRKLLQSLELSRLGADAA